MPSPPMTARRWVPVDPGIVVCVFMPRRLVVVGPRAAVVSQVKRALHGGLRVLGAAGVLGVVAGGAPVGVHVVHRVSSDTGRTWVGSRWGGVPETPHGGADRLTDRVRRWEPCGLRIARADGRYRRGGVFGW